MSIYLGTETAVQGVGVQEQCAANRSHGNPEYCHKRLLNNLSVRQADSRTKWQLGLGTIRNTVNYRPVANLYSTHNYLGVLNYTDIS